MRLYEYQCKNIFSTYGIQIPRGRIAKTAKEASDIAQEFNQAIVIKAQVLIGGRGKAGGIKLAKDPQMTEQISTEMLHSEIKGMPVHKLLIEDAVNIRKELYIGITLDRSKRKPILIASSSGGVEIENIAEETPDKICKICIDPSIGVRDYIARNLAVSIDLDRQYWESFISITTALWNLFVEHDATLVEINPLVITQEKEVIAIDGKMLIDDNALYRHQNFEDLSIESRLNQYEREAYKSGITYIKLNGSIGCIVNGAGLAMATMDLIKLNKGAPANFLDIGGGANSKKVESAYRILANDQDVKVILINIFGGITRCDEVSIGIINALKNGVTRKPMVVRLVGTNSQEAYEMISPLNIPVIDSLFEATKLIVDLEKELRS